MDTFSFFAYSTHLVPPTGLFWTNFVSLPAILPSFIALQFQPKRAHLMALNVWSKQKCKQVKPGVPRGYKDTMLILIGEPISFFFSICSVQSSDWILEVTYPVLTS